MAKIGKPKTAKGLALFCAKMALDKIADNIIVMDLSKIESAPSDYFVLCSCDSDVQTRALTEAVLVKAKEIKLQKPSVEGLTTGYWVLVDFFDVVLHIMLPESRNFYQIEKLWGDAKFMILDDDSKLKSVNRKDLKI